MEHDASTTHKKEQFILHFENSRYNDNVTKPQGKNLMLKPIACQQKKKLRKGLRAIATQINGAIASHCSSDFT